jgi:hypothetical protein
MAELFKAMTGPSVDPRSLQGQRAGGHRRRSGTCVGPFFAVRDGARLPELPLDLLPGRADRLHRSFDASFGFAGFLLGVADLMLLVARNPLGVLGAAPRARLFRHRVLSLAEGFHLALPANRGRDGDREEAAS